MRNRKVGLVVGWFVAASLAMLLASQAVAMVRDQVTDRPSRPATTLALETTTSTTAGATPTTQQAAITSTSSDQEQTTTTAPEAPTTSTTTATSTTTTPAAPNPTTTTTAPRSTNDEETFYLVGGWATLRCAGDDVALATYAPNLGYQVDIEATGPNEVELKFEEAAGDHRSKLEAQCSGGVLQLQIDEDEDD